MEVYDGQMYGCETKTVGGRLSGQARVTVLGKLGGDVSRSIRTVKYTHHLIP